MIEIVRLSGVFRDSWLATRAQIDVSHGEAIMLELALPAHDSGRPSKTVFLDDGRDSLRVEVQRGGAVDAGPFAPVDGKVSIQITTYESEPAQSDDDRELGVLLNAIKGPQGAVGVMAWSGFPAEAGDGEAEEAAAEEAAAEELAAEELVADELAAEELAAEEPVAEEPAAEEPAEKPAGEELVAEASAEPAEAAGEATEAAGETDAPPAVEEPSGLASAAGDAPALIRRSIEADFDREFYLQGFAEGEAPEDPLGHYLSEGWREGRNPTPWFSTRQYLEMNPDVAAANVNPFYHYCVGGRREGRAPDTLFDLRFVAIALGTSVYDPDLIALFLTEARTRVLSTHPLIDVAYLARQHPERDPKALALDFLSGQLPAETSPHPLFDVAYYTERRGAAFANGAEALRDFLAKPGRPVPIYLFDRDFYAAQSNVPGDVDPFLHFVANLIRLYAPVHPAFNIDAYWGQLGARGLSADMHPLAHYINEGRELGLSPVKAFDPVFYGEQAKYEGDDPLRHYFVSGYRAFPPSPVVDLGFLDATHEDFTLGETEFLMWFYMKPYLNRPTPHPRFSPVAYLRRYEDIRANNMCPPTHFLEWGLDEERWPNDFYSPTYVQRALTDQAIPPGRTVRAYFRSELSRRKRLLFVSHDASLTGAPAIILRLLEDFSATKLFDCCSVLDVGGARLPFFQQASHVYIMQNSARQHGWESEPPQRELAELFHDNFDGAAMPIMAFVNSAESRHIGRAVAKHGMPVVTLLHEAAFFYQPETFLHIYSWSDRVVLPSKYVLKEAERFAFDDGGRVIVRGQGLLKDTFGRMKRELVRSAVLNELGLPKDCRLVLSCGSIDLRKGVDFFVSAARRFLETHKDLGPTYFVWIGDGPRWSNTPFHFATQELEICGLQSQVRFIGPRTNVEPYFVAADVFLMTARSDPFPCVIHESMASGLPVIGFDNGGGAPELYGERGVTVPFGDAVAMCEALAALLGDEARRQRISADSRAFIYENWRSQDYFRFFVAELDRIAEVSYSDAVADLKPLEAQAYFLRDLRRQDDGGLLRTLYRGLAEQGVPIKLLGAGAPAEPGSAFAPDPKEDVYEHLNWFDFSQAAFDALLRRIDDSSGGVLIVGAATLAQVGRLTLSPRVGLAVLVTSPALDRAAIEYHWASIQHVIVPSAEAATRLADFNPQFASKTLVAGLVDSAPSGDWPPPPGRVIMSLLDAETPIGDVLRRGLRVIAALRRDRPDLRFTLLGRPTQRAAIAAAVKSLMSGLGANIVDIETVSSLTALSEFLRPGDVFLALGAEEAVPLGLSEAIRGQAFVLAATRRKWLQRKLEADNTGIGFELANVEAAVRRYLALLAAERPKTAPAEPPRRTAEAFHAKVKELVALAAEGAIRQSISGEYLQ